MRTLRAGKDNPAGFPRDRSAFTLLELFVVLLIVAVGMALIGPVVEGSLRRREVRQAVRELAAAMRYLESRAVRTRHPQDLLVLREQGSYRLEGEGNHITLPAAVEISFVRGGWFDGTGIRFRFYPNGSCSGGELVVAGETGDRYHIFLDPLVGSVTIEKG